MTRNSLLLVIVAVVATVSLLFELSPASDPANLQPESKAPEEPTASAAYNGLVAAHREPASMPASPPLPESAAPTDIRLEVHDAAGQHANCRIGTAERPGAVVTWRATTTDAVTVTLTALLQLGAGGFLVIEVGSTAQLWARTETVREDANMRSVVLPELRPVTVELRGADSVPGVSVWFGRNPDASFTEPVRGRWNLVEVATIVPVTAGQAVIEVPPTDHGMLRASAAGGTVSPVAQPGPLPPHVVFVVTPDKGPAPVHVDFLVTGPDNSPVDVTGIATLFDGDSTCSTKLSVGRGTIRLTADSPFLNGFASVVDASGECWTIDLSPLPRRGSSIEVSCRQGNGERPHETDLPPWEIAAAYVAHPDGSVKGLLPADSRRRDRPFWSSNGKHLRIGSLALADPMANVWVLSAAGESLTGSVWELMGGGRMTAASGQERAVQLPLPNDRMEAEWVEYSIKLPQQQVDVWLKLAERSLRGVGPDRTWRRIQPLGCRARFLLFSGSEQRVLGEW